MLSRYEYTPRGELAAVYDRGGVQVRSFVYDPAYPGADDGPPLRGQAADALPL